LIINELITNSIKHAFCDGRKGELEVTFKSISEQSAGTAESARHILEVRDNGIGLPPSLNIYASESLGLRLVTTLVEQLKGSIKFRQRSGTHVRIDFYT
jgi:two-component sensor histidine kinase